MALIHETDNFIVTAADKPHVDRDDGGHVVIIPKVRVRDRQHLTPEQANELMGLTIVVGKAMANVMNKHGVDVERINYQDNGNWSVFKPEGPYLHIHVYGRAKSAKIQKYGQALDLPHREEKPEFYEKLKPLTEEDIKAIREEIEKLI
ncbi:HIT domain-containing protein [Candidatus Woesearchaeota archaeon]|nr:HIT domain-containing protein [Candidatus Woesearchaeota archaeon]